MNYEHLPHTPFSNLSVGDFFYARTEINNKDAGYFLAIKNPATMALNRQLTNCTIIEGPWVGLVWRIQLQEAVVRAPKNILTALPCIIKRGFEVVPQYPPLTKGISEPLIWLVRVAMLDGTSKPLVRNADLYEAIAKADADSIMMQTIAYDPGKGDDHSVVAVRDNVTGDIVHTQVLKPLSVVEIVQQLVDVQPMPPHLVKDVLAALTGAVPDYTKIPWTWSVTEEEYDTATGSTEDGWRATVEFVTNKGWHLTLTHR